ncbi:CAP domain-containing protein [Oribacterium sp. WCC10]|uniref:CAP domain-containing protein n=1 Tax=Oribacterium sp. WCC10 TaxID=1855343 RepID=UPI000B873625
MQQKTVLHATNAWYNSHGHRKNMLLPEYTKIGVGMYEDHGERYWVQLFSN